MGGMKGAGGILEQEGLSVGWEHSRGENKESDN